MNQKIKAPGQCIKVDKLRLKDLNGKSTRAQRPALAKLNAKAVPEEWPMLVALLQREAHPNISHFLLTVGNKLPSSLDLAVVPREKPHTEAAAREQPRDSPVFIASRGT